MTRLNALRCTATLWLAALLALWWAVPDADVQGEVRALGSAWVMLWWARLLDP